MLLELTQRASACLNFYGTRKLSAQTRRTYKFVALHETVFSLSRIFTLTIFQPRAIVNGRLEDHRTNHIVRH